ncbi:peptidase S41 [Tateyamaria sp. SN6-1]|uniref:peptidase S41 n=1 Tax=Tateyamaria sp. SN6-1 TaxID=3092148 RepID=UPI0039F5D477
MAFETDRDVVQAALLRDPACAGLHLPEAPGEAQTADDFLLSMMRCVAQAGNGHSRVIPNAAIKVWPVRIVARGAGFGIVQGDQVIPLHKVNDVPVADWLDRFRPFLGGTAGRQSVIGAILLAWPAALGADRVRYETEAGIWAFGPDDTVPAPPLYPSSDTGMADPAAGAAMDPVTATWDDPIWSIRAARFDIPWPDDVLETVMTRTDAPLLFDLRGNTGGDFTRILPLMDALKAGWRGGRCAVLVDRFTFSAAIVAAVLLQHHLGARLFGEEMGDGLRFWAEGDTALLPDTGAHLRWSSAWHDWETGQPDDTTPPEIRQHMVATGPLNISPCDDGAAARAWVLG